MERTCFFIGHRDTPDAVQAGLTAAVARCIAVYGVTRFVVGQYGSFDRMAAKAVLKAKERYPQIALFLLIPYHPAERPIAAPPGFDGTYYPNGMETVPRRLAIVRANRYMAERSDCLIACVRRSTGNAQRLLAYAQARERRGLLRVITV